MLAIGFLCLFFVVPPRRADTNVVPRVAFRMRKRWANPSGQLYALFGVSERQVRAEVDAWRPGNAAKGAAHFRKAFSRASLEPGLRAFVQG